MTSAINSLLHRDITIGEALLFDVVALSIVLIVSEILLRIFFKRYL